MLLQHCVLSIPMTTDLQDELKDILGKEGPVVTAVDEVCRPMIRHWCEAMQDGNLLYTDEDYARKSKHGGIIAPPTMLLSWSMVPMWPEKEPPSGPLDQVLAKLDAAGFPQIMITSTTQRYHRPVFPGDRVSFTYRVDSVSPVKKTVLGTGHFVATTFTYMNQKSELVGTQVLTMLKYRVDS
jgi:acyl dehydratase